MNCRSIISFLEVTYATDKQLVIPSIWVRLIHIACQLAVLGYVIWLLIYQDGYQQISIGKGITTTKVKVSAWVNGTSGIEVWDEVDAVFPAKEKAAVFVTTSYLLTRNQTRGICCDQSFHIPCPTLTTTADYTALTVGPNATCNNGTSCQIYAWCPLEKKIPPRSLNDIENSTILIRNFVRFEEFDLQKDTFYQNRAIPGKNTFSVSDLILKSHNAFSATKEGAILVVVIKWECDIHYDYECSPSFQVHRLDSVDPTLFSHGMNFRYANYYYDSNSILARDQFKVYGIRFIFLTSGIAKKFSFVKLFISVGTGIGILSFAGFLADLISMWLLPLSSFYRNKKYMNIDEEEKQQRRMRWKRYLDPDQLNKAYFY